MGEVHAQPAYARGQMVRFTDRQDRLHVGEVLAIEATWRFGKLPLIVYTVSHPSYAGRRFHTTVDSILGVSTRSPVPSTPTPEADHG